MRNAGRRGTVSHKNDFMECYRLSYSTSYVIRRTIEQREGPGRGNDQHTTFSADRSRLWVLLSPHEAVERGNFQYALILKLTRFESSRNARQKTVTQYHRWSYQSLASRVEQRKVFHWIR